MSETKTPSFIAISQLEEALEERVTPDRRKADRGLPANVPADRRKGERRALRQKSPAN